jgi:hypothetical protein
MSDSDWIGIYQDTSIQNKQIESEIHDMLDDSTIDNQRVVYQAEEIKWFIDINTYLFYIYYLFVILVCYVVIFRQKYGNRYSRAVIIIGFIIYPFVIGYIERLLYNNYKYIAAYANGQVYHPIV